MVFHSSVMPLPSTVDCLPFALVLKSKALFGAALVLVSAVALAVSTMSSPTRGDLVFGTVTWLLFLVFTAVAGSAVLGLTVGLQRLLRRQLARGGDVAIASMLVGGVAAFPIGAEWTHKDSERLGCACRPGVDDAGLARERLERGPFAGTIRCLRCTPAATRNRERFDSRGPAGAAAIVTLRQRRRASRSPHVGWRFAALSLVAVIDRGGGRSSIGIRIRGG